MQAESAPRLRSMTEQLIRQIQMAMKNKDYS